jgi:hypothetical protein
MPPDPSRAAGTWPTITDHLGALPRGPPSAYSGSSSNSSKSAISTGASVKRRSAAMSRLSVFVLTLLVAPSTRSTRSYRDETGRKRYRTEVVHGKKREAEARLLELLQHKSTGSLTPRSRMTVRDLAREWSEHKAREVAPRTLAHGRARSVPRGRRRQLLRRLLPHPDRHGPPPWRSLRADLGRRRLRPRHDRRAAHRDPRQGRRSDPRRAEDDEEPSHRPAPRRPPRRAPAAPRLAT